MSLVIKTLAAAAASALVVALAFAQSTIVAVANESAPSLVALSPLPGPLGTEVMSIPYRLRDLRIVSVGGAAARDIAPWVGHLRVTLDDLPGAASLSR